MLADFDDFHGVRAAGLAERLADRQDNVVAMVDRAALEQLVLRHVQRAFRVARALELDRVDAAEQRHAAACLDYR